MQSYKKQVYEKFINDAKASTYYVKAFYKMQQTNSKFSFNLYALLFGQFWCFYRKMLGWGMISFGATTAAVFLSMKYGFTVLPTCIGIGFSLFFGFFGNYLYMCYVHRSVAAAESLSEEKRKAYYKENGGSGAKITLCMIVVSLMIAFAFAASLQ